MQIRFVPIALLVATTTLGCYNFPKFVDCTKNPNDPGCATDGGSGDGSGTNPAPDAGKPEVGPPSRGFSTAGSKSASRHFILYSTTGQPTPVGKGTQTSKKFVHAPGLLGGN